MTHYLKYISLSVLTVQTTSMVLVLRYSRTVPQTGPRYLASTTILISEVIKVITCLFVLFLDAGYSLSGLKYILVQEIWRKPIEGLKLIVPAVLYSIQNNLLFLALSVLDVATYQVTYQVKILTTAMFSVMILHKRLVTKQWIALVLLMVGVALVQLPSDSNHEEHKHSDISSKFIGFFVILLACFTSGFSSVYFEKLVKSRSQSLWVMNLQLASFSILPSCLVLIQDSNALFERGFFQGYYTTTWIVIFLQAFGGLIVSTVVKYADNILKAFATSISIVLSAVCSYYLLNDFQPSKSFFLGTTIVIIAVMLYVYPAKKPDKDSLTTKWEKIQRK